MISEQEAQHRREFRRIKSSVKQYFSVVKSIKIEARQCIHRVSQLLNSLAALQQHFDLLFDDDRFREFRQKFRHFLHDKKKNLQFYVLFFGKLQSADADMEVSKSGFKKLILEADDKVQKQFYYAKKVHDLRQRRVDGSKLERNIQKLEARAQDSAKLQRKLGHF